MNINQTISTALSNKEVFVEQKTVEEPKREFVCGDVVYHIHDGSMRLMCINNIIENDVLCFWFEETTLHSKWFKSTDLVLHKLNKFKHGDMVFYNDNHTPIMNVSISNSTEVLCYWYEGMVYRIKWFNASDLVLYKSKE